MLLPDAYPSRIQGKTTVIPRQDPVVYSDKTKPGPLTTEQLDQYESQGYLLFPDLFSADEVTSFRTELQALAQADDVRRSERAVTEPDSGEVRSIFDVTMLSQIFFALSRDKRVLEVAQQLLDDDVYIHQSRVNLKPGFNGKEFQWHSDFETWHAEDGMPRMRAVSCSISLTENNEFNGPLMLIPGSHYSRPAKRPGANAECKLTKKTRPLRLHPKSAGSSEPAFPEHPTSR
jgi:ectoine hydroxylase